MWCEWIEGVKSWRNGDSAVCYTLHSLELLTGCFMTWPLPIFLSSSLFTPWAPDLPSCVFLPCFYSHSSLVFFPLLVLWLSSFYFFQNTIDGSLLLGPLSALPEGFRCPSSQVPFHSRNIMRMVFAPLFGHCVLLGLSSPQKGECPTQKIDLSLNPKHLAWCLVSSRYSINAGLMSEWIMFLGSFT